MSLKKSLLSLANKFGYEIKKYDKNNSEYPSDFSNEDIEIIKSVIPFTMTSVERIFSLIRSVEYIVKNKIGGSIVECGVWKGGSMITVAKSLMMYGDTSRHLYLFDTFEGMPKPKDVDISVFGMNAKSEF